MQQWTCHIQGLENVFGAREVEKIGRQIDGVEDLNVDFAGETLILKANSVDVLKRVEKALAFSGYKILKKGYNISSVIYIPELEANIAQDVVRKIIGSHTQVQKLDIRPLSKLVYLTHSIDYSISHFLCELNNQQVTAHLRTQHYLKSRWQVFSHYSVLFAALLFLAGVIFENFYPVKVGALGIFSCYVSSFVITGLLLAKRAFTQIILHRKLTYGFLMLIVTLLSISHQLWFEASLLGLSLAASFMFEERAGLRLKQQWSLLKSSLPIFAFLKNDDGRLAVPVSKIVVDDVLVIDPGEYVPVDGRIIKGQGVFNAENVIANSESLNLKISDSVFAGQKLVEGNVEVRAEKTSATSVIHVLLKRMENLQTKITPKQKNISGKLDYLLYGCVTVSVILLVTQYLPEPALPAIWFEKALALMVIAGSAFVLTSIQFSHLFAYLYEARNGIYFYQPEMWQELAKFKNIVLDKEGVITNNRPEVQEVISLARYSIQDILSLSAGLASISESEKLQPIVNRAKTNNVIVKDVSAYMELTSKFIRAEVDGVVLTLGSQSAINDMGLLTKDIERKLKRWQAEGENVFLLADDKQILGMITVQDTVRSEVGEFVDFCHYLGFENVDVMSSDNEDGSQVIAGRYGFDKVYSDMSESEKEQEIARMRDENSILSVSTQTLFSGKVSVLTDALKSDLPKKENQIIFLGKNLLLLPYLIQVSHKLDARMNRLVTLLINVKLLTLIGLFTNILAFEHVIIIEFLLAVWVMSSMYRPKDMYAENKLSV